MRSPLRAHSWRIYEQAASRAATTAIRFWAYDHRTWGTHLENRLQALYPLPRALSPGSPAAGPPSLAMASPA
ncbi:MAG TPA: hypothetical protein VFE22_15665 [Edaphobacter sp.]|nr:hypothetical protein [Edaphobacter sp.]